MWKTIQLLSMTVLTIAFLSLVTGCYSTVVPERTETSFIEKGPIPASPSNEASTRPSVQYQLTYVSECGKESECVYAVDVDCLETNYPCLGKPQLMFAVKKSGDGPNPPVISLDWSPNGNQVVIEAAGMAGQSDIFIGDLEGQTWTNLTKSSNYEGSPKWSSSGDTISYLGKSSKPENSLHAYSVTTDGRSDKQLLPLLDPSFSEINSFSWSPGGNRIVFTHSDINGYYQLFVANPDGSGLKQLTEQKEDHYDPVFSPTGEWILYRQQPRSAEMISDLYVIQPDGKNEKAVTKDSSIWKGGQSWYPNGNWIAYVAKTQESSGDFKIQSEINLIKSDGTNPIVLTEEGKNGYSPVWRIKSP